MKNKLILLLFFTSVAIFAKGELKTIHVTGVGQLSIEPDTVIISTGVDSSDPVIGRALDINNRTMENVLKSLSKIGIESKDIETSNYNVYLYKPYGEKDINPEEYRVSNILKIKIRDIKKIDSVIDSVIVAGANKINGINFTYENSDNFEVELMKMAMSDARKKAELLAEIEGMKISTVISITEEGSSNVVYPQVNFAMSESRSKSSINSGLETLEIRYNVIYEIVTK